MRFIPLSQWAKPELVMLSFWAISFCVKLAFLLAFFILLPTSFATVFSIH